MTKNGFASHSLAVPTHMKTRSISPENFNGEKGGGGMAISGTGAECARDLGTGWKISPYVIIKPGETFTMADIDGPGMIKHIWTTDNCKRNRMLILRIYWDNSEKPSVEAPLCDFFASADYQIYAPLSSAAVCVNPKRGFNCYWEMPFYEKCRITVQSLSYEDIKLFYQIDYETGELPSGLLYFHAQFRRENPVTYKQPYTILDNVSAKGQYVGTYMFWGVNNNGWWGEGEIKFYLDGDGEFPTICGTGTEDYFCGAYDFDAEHQYREFCTLYAGLAKVIRPDGLYISNTRFSMYRWHICDPIRFDKDIRVTIQALGWRNGRRYLPLQDDISSVCYWYQDRICDTFPAFPCADAIEIV